MKSLPKGRNDRIFAESFVRFVRKTLLSFTRLTQNRLQ